jgi:GNAT superfamily N-acetyltransferase
MVDEPADASPGYDLREATLADVPVLVSHRRRMFEDMAAADGVPPDRAALDAMDVVYAPQLLAALPGGQQRAWVVEVNGRIVASGAMLLSEWLPRPSDLTLRLAYLHSVYTVPEHRRRGVARRIVEAAIDFCRAQGVKRLMLHASQAGRPLYESMGFTATNEMRLMLG